ncbi:AAA family ATPase [Mariniblastus fucicola]|uniref:ATP-dependent zinc metalloprotease FtsH n=1 Tax=Mariniblastus fucicola TaxID=980251 RepID=A0A5B9P6I6_9BACT|nr:AAA family ATPase [Mariniblastus fucicola]QEG20540.1 ATP-dependent zinc metalloprotease FtsH [Mariniblastus fucicola]
MSDIDPAIEAIRQAVKLAPGNVELITHLCNVLMEHGKHEDAESEYRNALRQQPSSETLQLGLARCYYLQGKNSHAMSILETLESQDRMFPKAMVLHAKLLFRDGDVSSAVARYKDAIDRDPESEDADFASLLGIGNWNADSEEEIVDGRIRAGVSEEVDSLDTNIERPKLSFSDVGGMESVKEDIRLKIIYPLEHAEMYAAYGKKIGGGILLYGAPGCGKTHLARATAGEVKATFISVGISDVLDMWIGNSERNLAEIFDRARANAPCVLFFDEVDALGASRSDMRQSAGRHLINQFLSEMDGVDKSNDGLLIIGATNAPWHIDTAFRRPGRFDQVIFVPPPDAVAREEILKMQLAGKPQEAKLDLGKVATKLADFSGADLMAVVDRTVEAKLQDAIKSGRPSPISTKDLLATAKRATATTREWFATARNHALYSNQGGTYDDILSYLKIKT